MILVKIESLVRFQGQWKDFLSYGPSCDLCTKHLYHTQEEHAMMKKARP